MTYSDIHSISRQLEELDNLQECILLDVVWKDQGTTIELHFNYIWDEQGQVRPDLVREKVVVLRLFTVQEFHVKNALNDLMLREPDQLNWGLSEVAQVVAERESDLLAYYENPVIPLHHVAVRWEGERRIDIIFSGLEIAWV